MTRPRPPRETWVESSYRDLLDAVHRLDLASRRSADRQLLDSIADDAGTQLSQQTLADRVGLTRAAVSRHVIDAERRGFVTVLPSSRSLRENSLGLTPRSRKIVTGGRKLRRAAAERCLSTVPADAVETTLSLLTHLESVAQVEG